MAAIFSSFGRRLTANNGDRGNLNYGGAYGAQAAGIVSDGGLQILPGDADAGMIAREAVLHGGALRWHGGKYDRP